MKKKLAAVLLAAVLMMAMPMAAFAETIYSPTQTALASGSNGVSLYVKANNGTFSDGGYILVESYSTPASNVPSGADVLATFQVTKVGNVSFDSLDFTFNVGSQYAGYNATIYTQHGDGATEEQTVVVASDGTANITVDKLSIFSIVIGDKASSAATSTDTSSTSPKTGIDTTVVAGGVAVALIGAGAAAYAIRRKVTE